MSERNDPVENLSEAMGAVPGLLRLLFASMWRSLVWALQAAVPWRRTDDSAGAGRDTSVARPPGPVPRPPSRTRPPRATSDELRARGAALLYDSADVWLEADTHPAYERILGELSPDEARILRLLALEGPQPSIDIRTNRPLGVGSELVASGLSMIGLHAGVRNVERTKADLNNLYRLGLVWFSREQVADPTRYQVVEVQPDVLEALKRAGRSPKTIHRSIHLTPFGEDFCEVCLPINRNGSTPA
jgi:hypothetical protein